MEDTSTQGQTQEKQNESLEEAIQFAKKYLEDLISFFGVNIDIYATANEEDVIELHVPSTRINGFLIGQRGDTMRAMQSVIITSLKHHNYAHARVVVDVADYKKQRAERLAKKAESWINKVKESGEEYKLKPMSAADRRTVHKTAAEHGLSTESVGEGRDRHIIIKKGDNSNEKDAA